MAGRFELPSGSGRRDRDDRAKFLGLAVPAGLVLWALVNLVTLQAVWPVMHGRSLRLVWVDDGLKVSLAAAVKLGIALACFGWYFLANHDDWSYWCQLVTLAGCALAVVTFVVGSMSFVW